MEKKAKGGGIMARYSEETVPRIKGHLSGKEFVLIILVIVTMMVMVSWRMVTDGMSNGVEIDGNFEKTEYVPGTGGCGCSSPGDTIVIFQDGRAFKMSGIVSITTPQGRKIRLYQTRSGDWKLAKQDAPQRPK